MNATEIMQDMVNNRGAVLEIYEQQPESLTLLAAAELLDSTHLFYIAVPNPPSSSQASPEATPRRVILQPSSFVFASVRRLHALAVGFYDEHGDLIARLAQIRECELDAPIEQQHAAQFAAWKKTMADSKTGPALQQAIDAARATTARGILSPVS